MAGPATRPDGAKGFTVEGLAIISADGMIADHTGTQPDALIIEADQAFFRSRLRAADVLVHGRNSGESGDPSRGRRRIILTRQIPGAARHPEHARVVRWNPAGATLSEACALTGMREGRVAVIGGTDVFGLFLEWGYDLFHLTRAGRARLPGGRPVFPGVPARSPEDLLSSHGLTPAEAQLLDASADLTLVTWRLGGRDVG
jgi:dihydrofolate reductase